MHIYACMVVCTWYYTLPTHDACMQCRWHLLLVKVSFRVILEAVAVWPAVEFDLQPALFCSMLTHIYTQ